ncbi:rod shape-determining protein MreD [Qipengyuania sp. 1NDW9]|uniref:Rod shape-determining protein MreD n=1 Tax=Qipengyuania xiapuensis TaxID=2867236 RepID=A0ABX8ZYZ9_9SPHN|nr:MULTISPECIES: rod shape-determining protein MreD [Qipengyuania]MBX7493021.1 rod shape-determining protein MreD [Qipengyuania xiapuensis]MBY6128645.1 rod shape-determining protein MreD [Qipengyuania aquimaris]QZD92827.1 rod shape-determining protein MreD [Qipengyuania xiapuensis]
MERNDPRARSDAYGSRINRSHSPLLANIIPWASILIASLLPIFAVAAALPMVPPLGFMLLIAWRLVRPGLLPVWAGFPLGLFDDLYSGQPFGFAILTWSVVLLVIELIENRWPWRAFWQDWFTACILIAIYLLVGWLLSGATPTLHSLIGVVPQFVLSILIFPLIARMVGWFDDLRLRRWKRV